MMRNHVQDLKLGLAYFTGRDKARVGPFTDSLHFVVIAGFCSSAPWRPCVLCLSSALRAYQLHGGGPN